jgi:hypothetical protein
MPPWSPSIGTGGRHASERLVAFAGMRTVVQQIIPTSGMTPLERLILTHMFDSEPEGDGLYFFCEDDVREIIELPAAAVKIAFKQSSGGKSRLRSHLAKQVSAHRRGTTPMEVDLTGTSWSCFLQDILRRTPARPYISIVTSFLCTKMRPDGFGGSATLITAKAIQYGCTEDLVDKFIRESRQTRRSHRANAAGE